ncbi:MAG: hypothetical protein ACHQ4H_15445, partial [Ktedonobacterales bacterium]
MGMRRLVVVWLAGRRVAGRGLARHTVRRCGPALALILMLLSGTLGQLAGAGVGTMPTAHAAGPQSGKNTFHASN